VCSSLTTPGNSTQGNNAYAQENTAGRGQWRNNHRPSGSDKEVFDFAFDRKMEPAQYIDAAITNLFYWVNIVHDLMHVYGFNEVSGNFQVDNFGNGGLGNDAVIANAQGMF
jgi:extracellular elastinolytic metalloproteinase